MFARLSAVAKVTQIVDLVRLVARVHLVSKLVKTCVAQWFAQATQFALLTITGDTVNAVEDFKVRIPFFTPEA